MSVNLASRPVRTRLIVIASVLALAGRRRYGHWLG
jgi:hypothetical protein